MVAVPQTQFGGVQPLTVQAITPIQTADLAATGPFTGALNLYYKVQGSDVSGIVDADDGHVSQLLLLNLIPATKSSSVISDSEAQSIAASYLSARSIGTAGLTETLHRVDRGIAQTVQVTWQRTFNGAQVPDSRMVEMDASTGVVFSVNNISRPYADPPTPSISSAQAASAGKALAAKTAGAKVGPFQLVATNLVVSFNPAGAQQLSWVIDLTTEGPVGEILYFQVTVDAGSGAATITGRG
jgi:Zn-dependent metalloprotease